MKLDFDAAMERINDERIVCAADVQAKALDRVVWVAEWHVPGCISESRGYYVTKADAIEGAMEMAETEDGAPRGMKTALVKHGRFDGDTEMFGRVINTVCKTTLRDIL